MTSRAMIIIIILLVRWPHCPLIAKVFVFRRRLVSAGWHAAHNPTKLCGPTSIGCFTRDETSAELYTRLCRPRAWFHQ